MEKKEKLVGFVCDMVRAVAKSQCEALLEGNGERIVYFKQRMEELEYSPAEVVIVIINVDDVHGGPLAETFMPQYDWQPIRNRGGIPIARGLVGRTFIKEVVRVFDLEAADKLDGIEGVAAVVVDHGVAEAFAV